MSVKPPCRTEAVGVQSLSERLNATFDRRDSVVTGDEITREKAQQWVDGLQESWAQVPDPPDEPTRAWIVATLREGLARAESHTPASQATLYLERLAHHFSGEEVHFTDSTQIRAFCDRIRRSVALLVEEFQELLTGRKKVQNDWSLYSSVATGDDQAMMTRDIRLGDVHGDLGRVLFDWRHPESTDAAVAGLKKALEELKHHQLATMAGYEQSVAEGARSLLDSLDPSSVEREYLGLTEDQAGKTRGGLKRFIPFRGYFLWQSYRKRFSQIQSEDARWYQRQFLPAFRQGYRDYMVARSSVIGKHTPAA